MYLSYFLNIPSGIDELHTSSQHQKSQYTIQEKRPYTWNGRVTIFYVSLTSMLDHMELFNDPMRQQCQVNCWRIVLKCSTYQCINLVTCLYSSFLLSLLWFFIKMRWTKDLVNGSEEEFEMKFGDVSPKYFYMRM